jgi:hypothetical protein
MSEEPGGPDGIEYVSTPGRAGHVRAVTRSIASACEDMEWAMTGRLGVAREPAQKGGDVQRMRCPHGTRRSA